MDLALQEDLVDCINKVEKELGNHYKENIYQNALSVELNIRGYLIQTEVIVPIFYNNVYVGFERADIVIYDKQGIIMTILELKSQSARISSKEINQLKKYLKNLKCNTGILVNFYEHLETVKVSAERHEKI